jgi:hypothetical protein
MVLDCLIKDTGVCPNEMRVSLMEKENIEENIENLPQLTYDKRKGNVLLIVISIVTFVVIFVIIWMLFFHVSTDYRDRVALAVEIADMVLDENITAREALEEHIYVVFEGMSDPTSRRERMLVQQIKAFIGDVTRIAIPEAYLSSLILIEDFYREGYGRSFEESYNNARNSIAESTTYLLFIRNQLAESIGIEQRQATAN